MIKERRKRQGKERKKMREGNKCVRRNKTRNREGNN